MSLNLFTFNRSYMTLILSVLTIFVLLLAKPANATPNTDQGGTSGGGGLLFDCSADISSGKKYFLIDTFPILASSRWRVDKSLQTEDSVINKFMEKYSEYHADTAQEILEN